MAEPRRSEGVLENLTGQSGFSAERRRALLYEGLHYYKSHCTVPCPREDHRLSGSFEHAADNAKTRPGNGDNTAQDSKELKSEKMTACPSATGCLQAYDHAKPVDPKCRLGDRASLLLVGESMAVLAECSYAYFTTTNEITTRPTTFQPP